MGNLASDLLVAHHDVFCREWVREIVHAHGRDQLLACHCLSRERDNDLIADEGASEEDRKTEGESKRGYGSAFPRLVFGRAIEWGFKPSRKF